MIANNLKRPILRWHGGKWVLAPWIISHFPHHKVYVEPFGGAASVLLRKKPAYAEIYNDLDREVVNLFRIYRDRGDELLRLIAFTPYSRDEFMESYNPSTDDLEQARKTVVRSFMGFSSSSHARKTGFRANSNRSGTTPAHDWKNLPDALPAIINRLRGVVIENRDAADVMHAHDGAETLHYVDPPYVSETRDKGGDYNFEMSDQQHIQLADTLMKLKGTVILSGYNSDLYNDLYKGWKKIERKAFADGARERTEVLWINRTTATSLFDHLEEVA